MMGFNNFSYQQPHRPFQPACATKQLGTSAFTRRHRIKALTSEVDESLFGTTVRPFAAKEPEAMRLVTKDLIRDLRIRKEDPSGESVILSATDFSRILAASHVPSKEEKAAALQARRQAREDAMDAADARKAQMRQADLTRKKNRHLTDLEVEAKDRAEYLLEKAKTLKMEQEDEVRKLNELIKEVECQVVWDAQIEEKKERRVAWLKEEKRLDDMMEDERLRGLESQEQMEQQKKQRRIAGRKDILDQIQERLDKRVLQHKLKQKEGQKLLEKWEKMQAKELEDIERKEEEQRILMQDIKKINDQNVLLKKQKKEEERLADLRQVEYAKSKQEREEEQAAQQMKIKEQKEKDLERLIAFQQKDKNVKEKEDDLKARKAYEATEMKLREKEKEEGQKQREAKAKLMADRLDQITQKKRLLSIKAEQEREEFQRVQREQQELVVKQRQDEEKRYQKVQMYAKAMRKQVRERGEQAATQRRERFLEGGRLEEEARLRRVRLDQIKEKKLRELKETGVSGKYFSEVERKARILPALFN